MSLPPTVHIRDMPAIAGTLSQGTIIGIAVGGAAVLLLLCASTTIYLLKRNDRRKRAKMQNTEATSPLENEELAAFLRADRPRDVYTPNTMSIIPTLPPHKRAPPLQIDTIMPTYDLHDDPQLEQANTKKMSPTRAISRLSTGIRDSWPLANSGQVPNALHGLVRLQSQSQSTITLNQVAPPGYIIASEPKWPGRTYSRNIKTKVSKDITRYSGRQRAKSEHQLTTILRSTSERLKPSNARRKSLSRTLTSFNRSGPPPSEKLPSPARKVRMKESQEALIANKSTASLRSSKYNEELLRTPSPRRRAVRGAEQTNCTRQVSPASSEDSLCARNIPDAIVPRPLASPSRQGQTDYERRRNMSPVRISTGESKNLPTMVQKGSRASVLALGRQLSQSPSPQGLSLINDPFYSSNTMIPLMSDKIIQPRPLQIRKSISTTGKASSPLADISGNSQTPSKRNSSVITFQPQNSPFQRSPQASNHTSPSSSQNRRKGHKRSKTVRMSVLLPPPPSSVSMVPEESEESDSEMTPFKFNPGSPGIRPINSSKRPSPAKSLLERRQHNHAPAGPRFDPHIYIPPKAPMGRTTVSPIGDIQIYSPTLPSPTKFSPVRLSPVRLSPIRLSPTLAGNYYTESQTSEDEFFRSKSKLSPSTTHTRRECSISPMPTPTALLDEMIGFPQPPASNASKNNPHLPPAKQTIKFVPATFSVLPTTKPIQAQAPTQISTSDFPQPSSSPALSPNSEILKALEKHKLPQPVLTLPCIPGHLTGPRELPGKVESPITHPHPPSSPSPSRSPVRGLPPRESLHQSICMLRRMNSEVSKYESPSSLYSVERRAEKSPSPSPTTANFRERYNIKERGSRHYHNLNRRISQNVLTSPGSKTRVTKHATTDSRVSKIKVSRKRILQRERAVRERSSDLEQENESSPEYIVDATPVNPMDALMSSPMTESESEREDVRRFSSHTRSIIWHNTLSELSLDQKERVEILELESPVRTDYWSDTIPKNVRQEPPSKLEAASPDRWSKIILSPSGEDTKENSAPQSSTSPSSDGARNGSRDVPSQRTNVGARSPKSETKRRAVRTSVIEVPVECGTAVGDRNNVCFQSHYNERKPGEVKNLIVERYPDAGQLAGAPSNGVAAVANGDKKPVKVVKDLEKSKETPQKLRKKKGSVWDKLSAGAPGSAGRESLYDSEGFLRSSPPKVDQSS